MFEAYSSGYYLGRLYVEPHEGDRALMDADQHERVVGQLYPDGTDGDLPEDSLVMKLDGPHFLVEGAPDRPSDTLAVPEPLLDDDGCWDFRHVLLAKNDRAEQLLRWSGWNGTGDAGGSSGADPGVGSPTVGSADRTWQPDDPVR